MVNTKILIVTVLNYTGYGLWSLSILNFIDDLLSHTFNFANIKGFLGLISMVVGVAFAVAKLYFYIKDAYIKLDIAREELKKLKEKNSIDYWKGFNEEFNKQKGK